MTPEEKAKELRDKYIFTSLDSNDDYETLKLKILIHAKQCALIAVDEILKAIPTEYLDVWQGEANMVINEDLEYWQEVKNELEKL